MNKIYMTKRGHDGKTVVCSEKTRARGKMKSLALAITTVIGVAGGGLAHATTTSGANQVTSPEASVAVGDYVVATGEKSVAIGDGASSVGDFGTATGAHSTADGVNSTANGYVSAALASDTIAIGVNSGAVGGSISKEDVEILKEIDNKITEYSREAPPVEPLTAQRPGLANISIETLEIPMPRHSGTVSILYRDDFDDATIDEAINFISSMQGPVVDEQFDKVLEDNFYPANRSVIDQFKNYLSTFSNLTEEEQRNLTLDKLKDDFNTFVALKDEKVNYFLSLEQADEARLAEITATNGQLVSLIEKFYSGVNGSGADMYIFNNEEATLILNNKELVQELWAIYYNKPLYEAHASELDKAISYSLAITDDARFKPEELSQRIDANVQSIYDRIQKNLQAYDTALAEYNAKVAAYDEAVKNRDMTEAERLTKLEEAKAELTTKANELGIDGQFESLSQVFGSLKGRAIAIGNSAYVSGDESVGVGYGNKVTGNQANVFGTHNTVTGDNNNVVGNNNTVATAGNNILGNAVTFAAGVATVGNVALGNDSVIGASVPTSSIDIRGTSYNFAGTNPTSVVTVGSAGKERQITNVAAGQVTATSTDAVNGSQLYAVVKAVEDLEAGSADTNTDKSVRVKSDSNLLTVTGVAGAADGITTMTDYTVSLNKGTFGADPATGEVTAPTDGVATTADVAEAINSGSFAVTANGTKLADVGFGDTLSFVDGNGTKAVIKNGGVAYDLNVKSTDGSIVTTPNTDGSLSISVNTSVLPKTVVDAGKGIDVTPVTNGNTTTYTVAVDDTIADKQYVADEIAKIKFPDVDLSGLITHEESVVAGDNITVSQDSKNSSGGKEFKVSLNSTLTGIDKIGGGTGAGSSISFGDNTINAGGSTISNIANPVNATDAATKAYVDDKATTVAKGDGITVSSKTTTTPSGAVNTEYTVSLDDVTKAQLAKEESVSAGSNIVVKQDTKNATGGSNYNVSLASDLTGIESISNGDTTVKLGDGAVNVGGSTITNVASPVNATDAVNKAYVDNSKTTVSKGDGITVTATPSTKDGATSVDYNVALDDATKATLSQVQVNKDAIAKGINTTTDDGKVTKHPLGGIVAVLGDGNNIKTVTTDTGAISVQMADNLKVNSVVIEGSSVGMGAGGISAGGNKIYNVAPGTLSPSSMDAVNGSQLYATNVNVANNAQNIGMLKERMDEFDDALDAQAAGARAALGIPQVTLPGKSMVGVGLGNYGDAQALAVGFSRLSDNARTILKGSIDANTKDTNKFGVSLGLGFQW